LPQRFARGPGTGIAGDSAVHANGSAHSQHPPRTLGSSRPEQVGRARAHRSGEPSSQARGRPSDVQLRSSAHVQQPSCTASVLPAGHHGASIAHVRSLPSSQAPAESARERAELGSTDTNARSAPAITAASWCASRVLASPRADSPSALALRAGSATAPLE
jgi:hypothetical protein